MSRHVMRLSKFVALITCVVALLLFCTVSRSVAKSGVKKNIYQNKVVGGSVVEGFQLYLSTQKDTFALNDAILLEIELKNTTKQTLFVKDTSTQYDYEVEARNETQQEVSLTEKGKQLKEMLSNWQEISARFPKIEPEKTLRYTLDISGLYQFKPGETYLITVGRKVGKKDNTGKLKIMSNTIRIKIAG